MTMYYNKVRQRLGFGLSRELWLVQVGIFLNTFGWGAVLPFEIIYLHDGRGFSLSVAGLVVGTLTGVAVVSAPLAGSLIDRFGARTTAAGAGLALAAGYAGLAFAETEAVAFAAATLAGAGNGALGPAQSTLLAALAPPELRHRATAVSRVSTNVGFGLGGAVGGVVAATGLTGLVTLFLVNALSYVVYIGVLVAVVREAPATEHIRGGYRLVLRDRAFVHLALTNVAIIGVGWGVLPWLVPPYAKSEAGIDAELIGLLMLANAATVVVAQVPIARAAEGRRRVVMIALGSAIFAASCVLIVVAGITPSHAYPALLAAAVAIGVGECFHSAALMPLVAELAPPGLRGRYMATIGLSWWIGLAVAPTAGAQLLSLTPAAAFLTAAAVAVAAAGSALALERELPLQVRVTPQPG
ncbi:MAG TPA: MFS transporter [Gaiellaceae bacterium]